MAYHPYGGGGGGNGGLLLQALSELFPIGWKNQLQKQQAEEQLKYAQGFHTNEAKDWADKELERQRRAALRGVGEPVEVEGAPPPTDLTPPVSPTSEPSPYLATDTQPRIIPGASGEQQEPQPYGGPPGVAINPQLPPPSLFGAPPPQANLFQPPPDLFGAPPKTEPGPLGPVISTPKLPPSEPAPAPETAIKAESRQPVKPVSNQPAQPPQKRFASGMWHELDDAARGKIMARARQAAPDVNEAEVADTWNKIQATKLKQFNPQRVGNLPVSEAVGKIGEVPTVRSEDKLVTKEPNEFQMHAALYGSQMLAASTDIGALEGTKGFNPVLAMTAPNVIEGSPQQIYKGAAEQWVQNFLRQVSGARVTPALEERYLKIYFPTLGDHPATIAKKAEARAIAEKNMKNLAGSAWGLGGNAAGPAEAPAAPAPGKTPSPQNRGTPGSNQQSPIAVRSRAERARLPAGTWIVDPQGNVGQINGGQ